MKNHILLLCSVVVMIATACGNRFDNVSEGISTSELKTMVGEPDSIRNDFFTEVWFYDTHIVSITNDTVTLIKSKREIREEMQQMQKEIEQLNNR